MAVVELTAPAAGRRPVAELQDVRRVYTMGTNQVRALDGISVSFGAGEFWSIMGTSGSGKSTLLNILGCIDRPSSGSYKVDGTDVADLDDDGLSELRGTRIGFVFQSFNLIPVLTAFENVEYPLILAGMDADRRQRRVKRLMDAVGLEQRAHNRPGQLSGGQRQRVAIARALARKPKLVIADEPTANLDSQTGAAIIALMRWMQQNFKISFIFSSHDHGLIKAADDLIVLRDGVIQSVRRKGEGPVASPAALDPGAEPEPPPYWTADPGNPANLAFLTEDTQTIEG